MKMIQLLRKDQMLILLMIILVPLAGEIKFYPFNDQYRVGFGSAIFFFFLLLIRKNRSILPGILTAIAVLWFRIGFDLITLYSINVTESIIHRIPAFLYYVIYTVLFQVLNVNRFHNKPLMIGIIGVQLEIVASFTELSIQHLMVGGAFSFSSFSQIIIISIFRSFFVISLFSIMKLYEGQLRELDMQNKNHHLLMLLSNLYEETVHLKKTLKNAENITKESYDLYRSLFSLKTENPDIEMLGQKALRIAGEIHDVKKDNQRIFAGLSKLISSENLSDFLEVNELMNMIIRLNEKYSQLLGKSISFSYSISGDHPKYHVYHVLSIINNLVSNSVEAIEESGNIHISAQRIGNDVIFQVQDNGPGIPEKYVDMIFKPGFTLKYDALGAPSTGIGLSYVKEIMSELDGNIDYKEYENGSGVIFTITLSIDSLIQKG
ncbi:ATP-binding protein [Bacillus sp. 03113]|uniref:ATP-binding protein n=1 Tax=Bacillus sp. 03113 TaxID=2578211 RepID=UPI001144E036|nr:ATP-binding protein [Bacillus sp. 03113]